MKKYLYIVVLLCVTSIVFASAFTPGNLVVVRIGNGSAALSSAATPVFLDEYTPAGGLVQSVALPTSVSGNNHSLTLSGSATSEGSLTLSVNGQLLVLAGYDAVAGLASVSSDSTTNRTIGTVSANGTINTSTGYLAGSAYKKNNFRGATTQDGSAFWTSGAGSSGTGGTWYLPAGSFTNTGTQVSSTISSTRAINIFGGQLYTSASSSSYHGVNSVGTGLPTAASQASANLPGFPAADTASSAYGFYFFDLDPNTPGVDVVYVCDDRSASGGGLLKYSLVGGSWVSNGNISSSSSLRGITGYASCTGVNLFISGQGGVFSLSDNSGYNQPISGSLTSLITPATNTVIRGIAFAPGTTPPAPLQASLTPTNVTCNGAANGAIATTTAGGTTPYAYNWGNSVTTQNRSGLSPGNYTVTVTDAGGCSATASAAITQPSVLTISASAVNVTCNGGTNGSVNVTVSGGTPSYTYNWTNGATSQNLSTLSANTYTVTVSDNHLCSASASASVTAPAAINIAPTVTNLPCSGGGNTGAVNINVTGGTPGYTYHWSNALTTQNITGLGAGTFAVTVTDAASCSATSSSIVSQSGSLTLSVAVSNVSCHGGNNGGIVVNAAGGTPSYNYAWSTGINTQQQSGLTAGSYVVTVTDNGGCTLTNSINVSQPNALVAVAVATSAGCFGTSTGSINLSVSGGTTPYTYSWNPASSNQNLTDVAAATYSVTVTDSNSCTATTSATVTQPASLSVTGAVTNVSVFNGNDGAIVLTASGGTSAYSYTWNSGSGADNTGLTAGNYCVTVTDAHSCTTSDCFNVSQPTGINEPALTTDFEMFYNGASIVLNASLGSTQSCSVFITDITGRHVFKSDALLTDHLSMQIPTGNISSGCYIVTMATNTGNVSKRIVLAR